jgi:hypothetical protein
VRLVQSGQYVEAIKLDQQFASARFGRGTQASQAAERRRKMIEDVIAALPSIERQEIEEKLRAVGQRKPGASIKSAQTKAAPVDLNMSWEVIPRAPPVTSGAPRFILGRPTYGHNQPTVVAGHMIEKPPIQPSSSLAPARSDSVVPPGLDGASQVRNSAPTLLLPSSRAGPRVGLVGSGSQTSKPFQNSSGSGGHRLSPLFPPHASREMRHSTANQTVLYSQKPTPSEESRADVPSLQRDVVSQPGAETRSDGEDQHDGHRRALEPIPVTEFSESVFSGSRPEPGPYPREPTEPLLPGAFRAEREVGQSVQNLFAHSPPTPPSRLRPAKSRRTARTSVPGGFDDASGEDDNVPPLPEVSSAKRTTRRRASRASSNDAEEDNVAVKPRRSSRLSAASSSSDHSPQKTSAPKATRKTRTSAGSSATAGIAPSTRSSTRKRR